MKRESDARRVICNTMLDLMEEKPMEKVTVKELTARANVSRSSFYMYFDSTYAVLEKLEDDFLEGQVDEIFFSLSNVFDRDGNINREILNKASRYLEDNIRTLRLLKKQDPSFNMKIEQRATRTINLTLQQPDVRMTDAEKRLFTRYYVGAMNACLDWGISQSDPEMNFTESTIFMARLIRASLDCIIREKKS